MTKLDIISDPICPWCYIGKTKLDRAMENRPDHPFEIEWHPFQLNPDMPREGMDRRAYLEHKFGGKKGAIEVYGQIAKAAEEAGITIDFEAIQRTPDTTDAHRLIHWAGLEGRQTPVVSRLFKAYFEAGQDISDPDVLVSVATAAGMDGDMVRRLLAQDDERSQIKAEAAYARKKGISGVPCFVVNNQFVVQGAQPSDLWERVIDDVAAKEAAQQNTPDTDEA